MARPARWRGLLAATDRELGQLLAEQALALRARRGELSRWAALSGLPEAEVVASPFGARMIALGQGFGTAMMSQAIDACFARPEVQAIVIDPLTSNTDAHRFYQRLGFVPEGRRVFNGEDDCLVHRLTRADWEARSC